MPTTIQAPGAKIPVLCYCGKRYAVPAEHAGRKIRCGRCKTPLRVSGGAPAKPKRAPRPSPRRAAPAVLKADPYAPPKVQRPATPKAPRSEDGSRDLQAEGHVVAIGLWSLVWSVLASMALLFTALALPVLGGSEAVVLGAVILVGLAISVFTGVVSVELMRQRAWARIGFAVLTGLQLLNAALGLVTNPLHMKLVGLLSIGWAIAQLWALFGEAGSRVFRAEYQEQRLRDGRPVPFVRSPFFSVPAVLLGLFVLLMGGLFALAVVAHA